MVTVEVFYSKTCPHCPAQKELARRFEDEATVRMTDVAADRERARNHGVRAVPTTVVSGPAVDGKIGFRGGTSEEKLATAIEVARGEKDPEALQEGSLLDAIKDVFR